MLVVADTSSFIGLIRIGQADVLAKLYGAVVIPPQVEAELSSPKRPAEVRAFLASRPPWLSVLAPVRPELIPGLDAGESAAISLARELNADLLLIDESRGRQAAIDRDIRTARTAAVLFDAANAGVLPNLEAAYAALKATNFRVPPDVLDALLALHRSLQARE